MRYALLLGLTTCLLFFSCNKEEEPMPAYIQNLAEIRTNTDGYAEDLILDQGEVLKINNTLSGLKTDTIIRVRALYQQTGQTAWLNSCVEILTPHLAVYKPEEVQTDPVSLIACWRGQHYVNLRLGISASAGGKHFFGFHQSDLVRHEDGTQTLQAVLLHNRNNDPQHYTREAFLSLPLRPLHDLLTAGRDTLQLHIQTHKGWEVKKILF